jgi:glycosyltransferase involved in cell wall biosynthesis
LNQLQEDRIMRVVHVVPTLYPENAGTTVFIRSLLKEQAAAGLCVQLYTTTQNAGVPNLRHEQTFENDYAYIPILRQLCSSRSMFGALVDSHNDIIHVHGVWSSHLRYAVAAQRRGKKVVLSTHGMLSPEALKFSSLRKKLFINTVLRNCFPRVDIVHATSGQELDDIRAFGLQSPVAIIPHAVDVQSVLSTKLRNKTVLSLGRIHPIKGLENLIAAWALVENDFPTWSLAIAGPGEYAYISKLRSLISELGLSRATIGGPLKGVEKDHAFSSASIFVLPSRTENFALTVAEAMAAATPVIVSMHAPWGGVVSNRCGWWVDPSVGSLGATLREAMSLDAAELQQMGERGRTWMLEDYSWESVVSKNLELYYWLHRGKGKPNFVR